MTNSIILLISTLLLIAYLFDLSASKTRIPSVILMMFLGFLLKLAAGFLGIALPEFTELLPVLGTVGLILIVLEGSLELELNQKNFPLAVKSFGVALGSLIILSFGIGLLFCYWLNISLKTAVSNAVPLAVISSAIAIPSAKTLGKSEREFVTYESSFSDILGVLLFNFLVLNSTINFSSSASFFWELILMLVVSVSATVGLALLLGRIKHPVKHAPIILMILLIYGVSKIYHLPGLIFILFFGLVLGNIREIPVLSSYAKTELNELSDEVHKFRALATEMAFLIRALFFIVFGYMIESSEIMNIDTLGWAVGICVAIFGIRMIVLYFSGIRLFPLVFIAPRGLITVLLFLSMPAAETFDPINKSLIVQLILLTAFVMTAGTVIFKSGEKKLS